MERLEDYFERVEFTHITDVAYEHVPDWVSEFDVAYAALMETLEQISFYLTQEENDDTAYLAYVTLPIEIGILEEEDAPD